MQLLRVRIRDEAVVLEETKKLRRLKEVIMSGRGATIKVYRRLHAGSNISIDDHHVTIQDLHERIEIEKSEEGVKLVKIGG